MLVARSSHHFEDLLWIGKLVMARDHMGWISTYNLDRIPLFPYLCNSKRIPEGNEDRSLLLFPEMNGDTQIHELEQKINDLLSPDPSLFLVEIKVKPTNNIRVFIDGDQGISIDKLVQFNRSLYKQLEGSGLFPNDDFSLEVSSPGLDEPLKLHRQYLKNIGRHLEVTELDGTRRLGKLLSASEKEILIEESTGKQTGEKGFQPGKKNKSELQSRVIPFENIRAARIQVKF